MLPLIEVTVQIFFSFGRKLEGDGNGVTLELMGDSTVYDAISKLTDLYPGLSGEILQDSGELRRFIQVRLNQVGVEHLSGLETELSEKDDLLILPKLGGG